MGLRGWPDGAALFVSAIAAMFGLERLGSKALENDEATSFFIAQLDWQHMFQSFSASEANGSPFYIALHFWKIVGESEQTLRLLPWLLGIGAPYLLFRLLAGMFDRWIAFAGSLLLAVNAFFISNLQELRTYSLSVLLSTAATLAFVRWIEKRTPGWALAYVGIGALLVYAHFIGALVLLSHALSLFVAPPEVRARDVMWVYVPMGVLLLPIAGFVLFADVGQVDWIAEPSLNLILFAFKELTGRGGLLQLVLFAALFAVAVARTAQVLRRRGRSAEAWRHVLVVTWAALPIVATLLISLVKPLFQARYVIGSLPAIAACAALGIAWLADLRPVVRAFRWNVPVYAVSLGIVVGVTASSLAGWYTTEGAGIWDVKAELVADNAQPGDAYLFYAPTVIRPFGYYAGLYSDRPQSIDEADIIYPPENWLGFSMTRFDPPLDDIEQEVAQRDRVWLVEGATDDRARRVEQRALVNMLSGRCGEPEAFAPNVLLFSGCRA